MVSKSAHVAPLAYIVSADWVAKGGGMEATAGTPGVETGMLLLAGAAFTPTLTVLPGETDPPPIITVPVEEAGT